MTTTIDTLTRLLQVLESDLARRTTRELYYKGEQPLAFLAPEARLAIGSRFGRIATNLCRVTVNALAERLRVTGFSGPDLGTLWDDWKANDLDQMVGLAHREALALGEAYVIVWADKQGRPLVTVESPSQVAVQRDPATREVIRAVKRWEASDATYAVLYEPDRITKWKAQPGAIAAGFSLVETLPNPLGVVPVVPLRNSDRLMGPAMSEIDDIAPLVDALNKTLADMLVSSEYAGRPRRWGTGIELVEDEEGEAVNPYPEQNRMMLNENPDAKFGALPAADLGGYEASVRVLQAQICAVSGLPPHYLGAHGDQPASADALRAAEASLVAKAEARQAVFGRAWEQVARLMVAVRTGLAPASIFAVVQWADPATRSVAQEADAVVKLYSAGLLPATYALKKLGYSDDEVDQIRQARRAETLDGSGANLDSLLGGAR